MGVMLTGKPDHLKSFDYVGLHRYFLTFCTFERRRVFVDAGAVDLVLPQILRAAGDERFAICAYCFMPDHLHLLAEGQCDASDGKRLIARAKQFSGFYYKKAKGEALWQRYGYERTLRDEDPGLSVARYIVENPVRARLAARVQDYPFVGSAIWTIEQILDAVQFDERWRRSG
jgi:putative transposase